MKKLLFWGALVAIAMTFVSCGEKKAEGKKIGEYELIEQENKLGVKYEGYLVLAPEYDEITEQYSSLFAKKGDGKTTIVAKGSEVVTAQISKITPTVDPEYFIISTPDKVYFWKQGSSFIRGAFNNIEVIDSKSGKFVFCNDDNGWGVMNLSSSLAPRKYEKVYIVININKVFAVMVYTKKLGWEMYDSAGVSNGAKYDTPSKTLEQQLKKYNTSAPYGVLDVDWDI